MVDQTHIVLHAFADDGFDGTIHNCRLAAFTVSGPVRKLVEKFYKINLKLDTHLVIPFALGGDK